MKIEWYRVHPGSTPPQVPSSERSWMDETPSKFAYRCLPLVMANQIGWVVVNENDFDAVWNGGSNVDSIQIHSDGERQVCSHFGSGILTFSLSGLVRTEPGVGLFVTGPLNEPKDGIAPLSGWVETEWSPFTFTVNWKFTRPDIIVRFRKDEPIATMIPVSVGVIEGHIPVIRDLDEDPTFAERYRSWAKSRTDFNRTLADRDIAGSQKGWQKHYHQGRDMTGSMIATGHRTKVKLKPFGDES